jgi:hypothetical protein
MLRHDIQLCNADKSMRHPVKLYNLLKSCPAQNIVLGDIYQLLLCEVGP